MTISSSSPFFNNATGFREVLHLIDKQKYSGDADIVMLVWNKHQVLPAEQYRKAHYSGKIVDLAVCQNPNFQKSHLCEKAMIYNFCGASSSAGRA